MMKYYLRAITWVCACILLACSRIPQYDLVINDGQVFNLETESFQRLNVGIRNGKIITITNDVLEGKKEISASGKYIYPGFIDAHCHFYGYASGLLEVNLVGCKSYQEVIDRVELYSKKNPNHKFIIGSGWDQTEWSENRFPTHHKLSEKFPNIPVVLTRIDGHAILVNQKVLDEIQIPSNPMAGGTVIIAEGEPTGVLIDRAMRLIPNYEFDQKSLAESLLKAQQNCYAYGLTGLADAGLPKQNILFIDSLQKAGSITMPIYAMVRYNEDNFSWLINSESISNNRLMLRSIKVYSDGALGSSGALLHEPYADDSSNYGLEITSYAKLLEICKKAKEHQIQVNVHAIGDSANHQVLSAFAEVLEGENNLRWRVEHAQVVNPKDSGYFKAFSILPSVQPTHATSDMNFAEDRLGSNRIHHAYAYQNLLKWSDGHLPLGTDFPVEDINPFKTFYAAVVRKDSKGMPGHGFLPEQKLSRKEALKGMTIWAAYAQFMEDETGSINENKWADLFISDTDLLQCAENQILKAQVEYTIVRGEVVYNKQ